MREEKEKITQLLNKKEGQKQLFKMKVSHTLTSHATYIQQGWKGGKRRGGRGSGVKAEGLGREGKGE